jgi:anti-sigma factor RsiW
MNCAIAQEMLGPFFDGELDVNSGLQLRLHLSGCDGCTAALSRLHSRCDMIRNSDLSYQAPPDLEARIRKGIHADRRTASNWRVWSALAAAILVACTLSIHLLQQRASRDAQFGDQVVSSHIRAMMTGHTTDIISTDRHTVKPWFNGRIDFSPPVSDLAPQGFPLAGGRVDYLAGRSVATLVYHRRKHVIDLFIRPAGTGDATGDESSKGYNVIRWKAGEMYYVAVSDLNKMELEQFKNLLLKP